MLDYLSGPPAEALLTAISQKGLKQSISRIRFIQIGSMAGPEISLSAATLRSTRIELRGSGFGSASLEDIAHGIRQFFYLPPNKPFASKPERRL